MIIIMIIIIITIIIVVIAFMIITYPFTGYANDDLWIIYISYMFLISKF